MHFQWSWISDYTYPGWTPHSKQQMRCPGEGSLVRAGPRRLDPDQAARVTEKTLEVYRAAALSFSTWALQRGLRPSGPDQWDDLWVEFKNDQ